MTQGYKHLYFGAYIFDIGMTWSRNIGGHKTLKFEILASLLCLESTSSDKVPIFLQCLFLQCFDAVGWAAGRASSL